MYFCPECDKGPFEPADWWEHFQTHNTPWLQQRNPKNLERTDLGYGEDLQRTTVPTHDMPNEWHELTNPPFDGGLSTDPPGAHMGAQVIPDAPATPIPKAHKMVWLSQPNNASLKYWHHNPSNTTYAWDFWGKNNDDPRHHWEMARHLDIRRDNGDTPLSPHGGGLNDWEGGFFTQNSGKHPADIWGLPAMTDYAPINGGDDLGNSLGDI